MTLQEILHEIVSALSNPRDHLHEEIDKLDEQPAPVEPEPEPEPAPVPDVPVAEPEPEPVSVPDEPAEEVTPDAPAE